LFYKIGVLMKNMFFFLTATVLACCVTSCNPVIPPVVEKFTITAIAGPNGTITPSQAIVEKNGSATFKVIPDKGYVIEKLENDGNVLPPLDTYTIMNVSKKDTLKAFFKFKYDEGTPEWYFTQFVWVESKWETLVSGYWYDFTHDDSTKGTFWYNPDGKFDEMFNNHINTGGTWSLDKTTDPITLISTGSHPEKVEFCDSTKMVLSFIDNSGFPVKITYTNDGVKRFK